MSTDAPKRGNPKEEFEKILKVDYTKGEIAICLASLDSETDAPRFERLQITGDLANEFRDIVRRLIGGLEEQNRRQELELRTYDTGSKPDPHEIEHLDLSQHDFVATQIESLSSLVDMDVFQEDQEFVSGLRFYVIVIQPPNATPIFFFRMYNKKKELGRSSFFGALLSGGQYDRVREPLFLFDPYIDCFSLGNRMFIIKQDNFQKVFRFFELVLKTARKTLATIKARVPISNFDEFAGACEGHLQKQVKLRNISERPYLAKITIVDLKKVINQFSLPIKTVTKNGKEMLVYDAADKWALLRLLDDDYLKSLMTDQNYEVTGKRPH